MKSYPRTGKFPLIALLSLGLLSSPIVVNASDGHHNSYGHGKPHHKNYGYRESYREGYQHSYKRGRHYIKPQGRYSHYAETPRHNRVVSHYDRPVLYLGLFSSH